MRKFRFYFLAVAAMVAAAAVSCKEPEPEPEPALTVSDARGTAVTKLTAVAAGEEVTLALKSNVPWTAKAPEWAPVTPASGDGDANLKVNVAANEAEAARNGELVFTYSGKTLKVAVEQAGKEPETPPTPEKKMKISNADDWATFAASAKDYTAEETVTLEADITVTAPVDTLYCNFDGQNHTVTYAFVEEGSLATDAKLANLGLFRVVKNVKVSNIKTAGSIEFKAVAESGTYHVGGVVGMVPAGATIENCVNGVNILAPTKNTQHFGGIAGYIEPGDSAPAKIANCVNNGKVEMVLEGSANASQLGGIVGHIQLSAEVVSCVNNAQVTYTGLGTARIGGIVGYVNFPTDVKFTSCSNSGKIIASIPGTATSTSYIYSGGISGYYGTGSGFVDAETNSVVYDGCVNTGEVIIDCGTSDTKYRSRAGGIAALASCGKGVTKILNCENKGNVSVLNMSSGNGGHVGGICAYCEATTTLNIDNCSNDAEVLNSTGNYNNSSVGAILGSAASGNAQSSTITNIKVLEHTVVTSTVGGAVVNGAEGGKTLHVGLVSAGAYGLKTALTGTISPCVIKNGAETIEITADNYKDYITSVVPGEGGSNDGVVWNGPAPAGISNVADLKEFRDSVNKGGSIEKWLENGVVKLKADLDLGGEEWVPIGNSIYSTTNSNDTPFVAPYFTGVFDGQGHTIDNFKVTIGAEAADGTVGGLFGVIYKATVKNLKSGSKVSLSSVAPNMSVMGSLVAWGIASTIDNCESNASLDYAGTANNKRTVLGGVAGSMLSTADGAAVVSNCVNNGKLTCTNATNEKNGATGISISGVVAFTDGAASVIDTETLHSVVSGCVNNVDITAQATRISGVVATINRYGKAIDCVNNGKITCSDTKATNSRVAGICSAMGVNTHMTGCKNYGDVIFSVEGNKTQGYAGGVLGQVNGDNSIIDGCENYGAVLSDMYFGSPVYMGLIIANPNKKVLTIKNCKVGGSIGPVVPTAEKPVVTASADNFDSLITLPTGDYSAKVVKENNAFATK